MVIASGTPHDYYMPFAGPFVVEDAPQSSEDGSGLHSPTFMDSDATLDGQHRNEYRAPPPDLDIHNVAGLLASHFAAPNPPAYTSNPFVHSPSDGALSYSPYLAHPREYDDEPRVYSSSRASRGHYGSHHAVRPPSPSFLVNAIPSNSVTEQPRPLTIPSLLPSNSPSADRVYIGSATNSMQQAEISPTIPSGTPTSPHESTTSSGRPSSQPTASGSASRREPSMVVIACRQCRSRKIRCDSTRPSCNNCTRRQNDCQYDSVPKRRGPDKNPGTRQRSCKKRPADGSMPMKKKQRRGTDASPTHEASRATSASGSTRLSNGLRHTGTEMSGHLDADIESNAGMGMSGARMGNMGLKLDMNFMQRQPQLTSGYADMGSGHPSHSYHFQAQSASNMPSPTTAMSFHTPMPRSATMNSPHSSLLKQSPSRQDGPFSAYDSFGHDGFANTDMAPRVFSRQLELGVQRSDERTYLSPSQSVDFSGKIWWDNLLAYYGPSREQSEGAIMKDLSFLFSNSIHWLSFLNDQYFFRKLLDVTEREKMQPSLVLSALALATLLQSSELGEGHRGRVRALTLRNAAQQFLENSWNASLVDSSLAQAAMLIAIFESSAHPDHTGERACESLLFLDQIIRALALTQVDANDPHATIYKPQSVPVVPRSFEHDIAIESQTYCAPPIHSPHLDIGRMSPTWASSIRWDPAWNAEEIEREETRRLCWAALSLAAAHTAHCAAFHKEPLDLFLSRPENYRLLFPGEKQSTVQGNGNYANSKQSVWALYCRSMLLWNSCLQLRKGVSDTDKAEFAMEAWLEAQELQDTLESQPCAVDSHLAHMTKEHIFNTRITVSYEFRRLQDIEQISSSMFNRRQATDWIHYQSQTAKRFEIILHDGRDPQAQVLARRPFYVWWFMNQLAISMSLYVHDNSLKQALELCKAFLVPLDVLSALWPCKAQRDRYIELRAELSGHCETAGLAPLPPPDFSLPISLRL